VHRLEQHRKLALHRSS